MAIAFYRNLSKTLSHIHTFVVAERSCSSLPATTSNGSAPDEVPPPCNVVACILEGLLLFSANFDLHCAFTFRRCKPYKTHIKMTINPAKPKTIQSHVLRDCSLNSLVCTRPLHCSNSSCSTNVNGVFVSAQYVSESSASPG